MHACAYIYVCIKILIKRKKAEGKGFYYIIISKVYIEEKKIHFFPAIKLLEKEGVTP